MINFNFFKDAFIYIYIYIIMWYICIIIILFINFIKDIIYSGESYENQSNNNIPTNKICERCGYMSSNKICKACVLLEGLNKGLPRLVNNIIFMK